MPSRRFIYNRKDRRFKKKEITFREVLSKLGHYLLVSLGLALVFYVFYALFFSSTREKELIVENRYLQEEYNTMEERMDLLHDAVSDLERRDKEIYGQIFNSLPPNFVPHDTIADYGTVLMLDRSAMEKGNYALTRELLLLADRQDAAIDSLNSILGAMGADALNIPSILPVPDFSLARTGASVGMKMNPFYKTLRYHEGLDLVVPTGTNVLATASGRVVLAGRNGTSKGNQVVIDHGNSLRTEYSHLNDILVRSGQYVRQGERIGRSGSTGTSFTPHLHYAVFLDGEAVDPVNYFFGSLDVHDLRRMLVIATNTGQSLD